MLKTKTKTCNVLAIYSRFSPSSIDYNMTNLLVPSASSEEGLQTVKKFSTLDSGIRRTENQEKMVPNLGDSVPRE